MRLTVTRLHLLPLLALLSSCSDVVPDSGLMGTYVADYRGDTATLSLRADHTFTHTVVVGGNKIEEQTSTWRTTELGTGGWSKWTVVDFTKFVATPAYRDRKSTRLNSSHRP